MRTIYFFHIEARLPALNFSLFTLHSLLSEPGVQTYRNWQHGIFAAKIGEAYLQPPQCAAADINRAYLNAVHVAGVIIEKTDLNSGHARRGGI
jgi:hypothetical protein